MKNIAEKLIEKIDDSGYLPNDLSEFADNIRISRESLRRAVKFIQSFEPAGIGAQSLQECLLIQLERKGQGKSLAAKIVKKYLPEIEKNRIPFIAESLHAELDEVNTAIDSIRSLNPIPASAIASDSSAEYIIPEAEVIPKGNEYDVISNRDGYYPRLRLSQHYLDMADSKKTDSSTKDYLRKKIASGQMLISNLELRESTIMKVARVIVSMQHDFMKYGPDKLQPMTLQDVADRLGMHATTISRAAANKYIKTPQGIFSFKDFFSNGFRSKDGDEISASGIREQIKNIISQEDPHKPYSDSKITEILQSKGLDIKRRTVAKYREELGIESSSIRKVF